jgi:hypothetical protein
MSLEIHRGRSKWWYGRVEVNGRKLNKNLGVEVRGVVPSALSELGDPVFERSRAKAQAALEKLQLDLKKRSTAEELVQTIHEIRTGARVSSILLDDITIRCKALPRRRPLSDSYVQQAESWITRFVKFAKDANGALREMSQVQSNKLTHEGPRPELALAAFFLMDKVCRETTSPHGERLVRSSLKCYGKRGESGQP